jgi:hypothetical protein
MATDDAPEVGDRVKRDNPSEIGTVVDVDHVARHFAVLWDSWGEYAWPDWWRFSCWEREVRLVEPIDILLDVMRRLLLPPQS